LIDTLQAEIVEREVQRSQAIGELSSTLSQITSDLTDSIATMSASLPEMQASFEETIAATAQVFSDRFKAIETDLAALPPPPPPLRPVEVENGKDGVGIKAVWLNEDKQLLVELTDARIQNLGSVFEDAVKAIEIPKPVSIDNVELTDAGEL